MCGFAGFNWSDEALLIQMARNMAHRGPDGEGFYQTTGLSFAHRRLAIIDLSSIASQPMKNHDNTLCIVYNGEIYNYIELRSELAAQGYRFNSKSDTEVLLNAYAAWGENMLDRLNGMFAFVIHDRKNNSLFLARDRYGIKPLHYHHQDNRFSFASEIKTLLLDPHIPRGENPQMIYDYLAYNCYNHTDQTFFKSIYSLLPGHFAYFNLDRCKLDIRRWYSIPNPESGVYSQLSLSEVKERFRDLFFDSLKLQLRTDVEIGSCLSGGLDSSAIVSSIVKELGVSPDQFKTFSAVVKAPPRLDESPYIDAVLQHTHVKSYTTSPTHDQLLLDLDKLVYAQDEPFGGTSIYAQWEVMKLSHSKGIKVLLDGQGSDELLAGYPFFFGYYALELMRRLKVCNLFKECFHAFSDHSGALNEKALTPFLLLAPAFFKPILWRNIYGDVLNNQFIRKSDLLSQIPSKLYEPIDLNIALQRRLQYCLPQLLREEDRSSMAFSIETRVPFLDHRLVDFLSQIASKHKLFNGKTKFILRHALQSTLPQKIVNRTVKLGYSTPMDEWMRHPTIIERTRQEINDRREQLSPYIDFDKVERLISLHQVRKTNSGQLIWKTANLAIWFRLFHR